MDEVSVLGSQDYDSEMSSDSDMESVDVDDLEEGEIKQGMDNNDRCQEDDQLDGRPESSLMNAQLDGRPESSPVTIGHMAGNKESSEGHLSPGINACGESQRTHGDSFEVAHGQSNNEFRVANLEKSKIVDGVRPNDDLLDSETIGPNKVMPDVINIGPNSGLDGLGPRSAANLGKINRGERSPPSVGSTQGLSSRLFNQSDNNVPLDLNTPVREISGNTVDPSPIPNDGTDNLVDPPVGPGFEDANLGVGDATGLDETDASC
ncbi:hypothetical protein Hanom_Chr03g00256371 [Helianthus anomalus]